MGAKAEKEARYDAIKRPSLRRPRRMTDARKAIAGEMAY
jgi:hypothetical protein